jgi:hypothetical protein
MKKKYKLKKWVKVVITLILVSVGIVLYHILGIYGAYASKSTLGSIFICLGWFWLLVGQIGIIYTMWEE